MATRLVLLLACGALLAACGNSEPVPGGTNEAASTKPTMKSLQPSSTRPTSCPDDDYTFVMSWACECLDAGARIEITVESGKPVDARYMQNGYDHHAGEQVSGRYRWLTLDDLIDLASTEKADKVRVIWPDGQDYPRAVDVDYNVNTADDEVSYLIYHVSTGAT
jgi:Family of unknown function (DUF6174)